MKKSPDLVSNKSYFVSFKTKSFNKKLRSSNVTLTNYFKTHQSDSESVLLDFTVSQYFNSLKAEPIDD